MNLNQSTLNLFEDERVRYSYYPPNQSNSFYDIGEGTINIFNDDHQMKIFIESGTVNTGSVFVIDKDPYIQLEVSEDTKLIVNDKFFIKNNTLVNVYGTLELQEEALLSLSDNSRIVLYPGSVLIVNDRVNIQVDNSSDFRIYGEINVPLSSVDSILSNDRIYVDTSAVLNVTEINMGDREYSLTDFYTELRDKTINPYVQGEHNVDNGRIGYRWLAGNTVNKYRELSVTISYGTVVFGDFKLSILGKLVNEIEEFTTLTNLTVNKNTKLYISEEYGEYRYVHPKLYIGRIIDNCNTPGTMSISGEVYVSGNNAQLVLDRSGSLTIEESGTLYLQNNGKLLCTNNMEDEIVLTINGTLIMDDISQVSTFNSANIEVGENAKIIILNNNLPDDTILFSTPNGILESDLYRIFKPYIEQVEYHIQPNTGIKIDQYYEYYPRDMTQWYADRRIELAIHQGLLIWHDNAFIELDSEIIPWVNNECTLYDASTLFKTTMSGKKFILSDVAARLKYAGSGNIRFKFIDGDNINEITLILDGATVSTLINKPLTDEYVATSNRKGTLFIRNKINDSDSSNIISSESKMISINEGETTFIIK